MSKATGSAYSMQVSLSMAREVKVYHHINSLDINTSSEEIWK